MPQKYTPMYRLKRNIPTTPPPPKKNKNKNHIPRFDLRKKRENKNKNPIPSLTRIPQT